MRRRAFVLGAFAALARGALGQTPDSHEHRFDNAHAWSKVFDDPARDAWQKPHEVIRALALRPNAVVADVGAGTGYFAMRLARMLPQGRVFAVDQETAMVEHLAERAKREGLPNVTSVAGTATDPRLPEPVDLALFVDVYHHIGDRPSYFTNLRRSLKPGGRIAVIDFRMDSPAGPPKASRVGPTRVKAEMKRAGFDVLEEHEFLPRQYFLVFGRP